MKRVALVLCLFLAPAFCYASDTCPWINAATAFGAIGASPEAAGTHSTITSGSCTFSYRTQEGLHELRVTVEPSSDAPHLFASRKASCGSDARPLTAIGNEAIVCAVGPSANVYGKQVIGRVRDQIFTVTMTVDGPESPARVNDLQQKIEMLAELIAGNLF
jgi:hypothetical protein